MIKKVIIEELDCVGISLNKFEMETTLKNGTQPGYSPIAKSRVWITTEDGKPLGYFKVFDDGDIEFHKEKDGLRYEYELYMKKVTDAFVDMQSDKIYGTIGTVETVEGNVFYEVIWNGGLEYKFELNAGLYMSGVTYEEMKKYNAETALMYLKGNTLTYEEWYKKYKTKKQ